MIEKESTKYTACYTGGKNRSRQDSHGDLLEIVIFHNYKREYTPLEIKLQTKKKATITDWKLYFRWLLHQLELVEKCHFE